MTARQQHAAAAVFLFKTLQQPLTKQSAHTSKLLRLIVTPRTASKPKIPSHCTPPLPNKTIRAYVKITSALFKQNKVFICDLLSLGFESDLSKSNIYIYKLRSVLSKGDKHESSTSKRRHWKTSRKLRSPKLTIWMVLPDSIKGKSSYFAMHLGMTKHGCKY